MFLYFLALRVLCVVVLCLFRFVVFCFLVFFSESLPGDDVLCRLLSRPLPSVCFLPWLFWCNSIYVVTTAGFVANQFMM